MKNIIATIFLLLPITAFGYGVADSHAVSVSIINLIATPDLYHNKIIRVIGVGHLEFEANVLCLSTEDIKHGISKNCLWVTPNLPSIGASQEELSNFNGGYVLIEGTFNKNREGHMGLNSGSIDNVTRYQNWAH
jgi:hypothetical protein